METIRDTFCKNFKRFVEASSLNQKSIAARVGVSEQTFYRWAKGENAPGHENLEELSKVLGVAPFDFYRVDASATTKSEPVSIFIQKLSSVPDEIYDLAQDIPKGHEIWEKVAWQLEAVAKQEKEREKSS